MAYVPSKDNAEDEPTPPASEPRGPAGAWLVSDPKWTQDNDQFRSRAYADTGANGPATNLLRETGCWNAEDAREAQWVLFDLGEEYVLNQIEIDHNGDQPECPKECELQYSVMGGPWCTVSSFRCSQVSEKQVFPFADKTSRKWKLVVNNTYGGGGAGACINRVRFHGYAPES